MDELGWNSRDMHFEIRLMFLFFFPFVLGIICEDKKDGVTPCVSEDGGAQKYFLLFSAPPILFSFFFFLFSYKVFKCADEMRKWFNNNWNLSSIYIINTVQTFHLILLHLI